MPAQLAAIICISFILYLYWTDMREDHETSNAVWIPLIWMFLAGSRYVSQWLNLGGSVNPMDVYQDGSQIDGVMFATLIVAGATILLRRGLDWSSLLVHNKWIWFYFLFCAISIVWSDESFVSLKRWIKAIGDVIMALVILTEERPYQAAGTILRRLAFLILPLSVLFIRYYPELGRYYHMGVPTFTGVATSKNTLGQTCLIAGVYFSWSLIFRWREDIQRGGIPRVAVNLLFLALVAWLLYMANSATSMVCLLAVVSLFAAGRVPALASEPRRVVWFCGIALSLFLILELSADTSNWIIEGLGRSKDLTTRVPMWELLLRMNTNPLIGVGYESFWSGVRFDYIWRQFPGIIQAHNGYLDLYLNIGAIGLLLLLISIADGFAAAIKELESDYATSLLRIAFIIAVVLNNWTEATIKPVSNMFLLLLWGIMDGSSLVEPIEDNEPPDYR